MRRQQDYQVAPRVRRLYKGFRETTAYLINQKGAKAAEPPGSRGIGDGFGSLQIDPQRS